MAFSPLDVFPKLYMDFSLQCSFMCMFICHSLKTRLRKRLEYFDNFCAFANHPNMHRGELAGAGSEDLAVDVSDM